MLFNEYSKKKKRKKKGMIPKVFKKKYYPVITQLQSFVSITQKIKWSKVFIARCYQKAYVMEHLNTSVFKDTLVS